MTARCLVRFRSRRSRRTNRGKERGCCPSSFFSLSRAPPGEGGKPHGKKPDPVRRPRLSRPPGGGPPGECLAAVNGHPIVDVLDYKYHSYDPELTLTLTSEAGGAQGGTGQGRGGRIWASPLPPTSWTGPGPAPTTASSASWTRCRRGCGRACTSRMTTPACPSSWATTSPSPTSAGGSCSGSVSLHISPINISVHATDPEVRRLLCWATSGGGASAWSTCAPSPRRGS